MEANIWEARHKFGRHKTVIWHLYSSMTHIWWYVHRLIIHFYLLWYIIIQFVFCALYQSTIYQCLLSAIYCQCNDIVWPFTCSNILEKYICLHFFYQFPTSRLCRLLAFYHTEENDRCIQHSKYHIWWWPGDAWCQVISSNGIDLLSSEYSGFTTNGVNILRPSDAYMRQ